MLKALLGKVATIRKKDGTELNKSSEYKEEKEEDEDEDKTSPHMKHPDKELLWDEEHHGEKEKKKKKKKDESDDNVEEEDTAESKTIYANCYEVLNHLHFVFPLILSPIGIT
jgi:hypothetical protein